jgi:hypothetical protein
MVDKKDGKSLLLYLKENYRADFPINVEISIKSETFKKTANGYECNADIYEEHYNKVARFNESTFEILALGHPLNIPYENVDNWMYDELKRDKINLYLNMALVLYSGEKLKLEDLDKIRHYL